MTEVAVDQDGARPRLTFIVRRGEDLGADVDDLMVVYAAAVGPNGEDVRARRDIILSHCTRPDAVGVLVFADERLIGFCYGIRTQPGQWWHDHVSAALPLEQRRWLDDAFVICELAVLPDHRDRAIGRQLLERVLALDEANRRRAVLLSAEMTNPVERLYRALGFHDIVTQMPFTPDGPPYRIMGRRSPA